MSQRLPELIEPDRMAETGRFLSGTITIGKMKRLLPLLYQAEGKIPAEVIVELMFGVDESGQANVTGSFETDVTLQCQRCMQELELHIADKISLAIVHNSEQANNLPSYYEPLVVDEETVSLLELVEDEILLALPSVPLHEPEQCQVSLTVNKDGKQQHNIGSGSEKEPERKSPFDVLKQLRTKEKGQ